MAATPFKAMTWTPQEILSEDKMDALANNQQWLKENKPDALYTLENGTKRYQNVKILSGRVMIPANPKSDSARVNVNFPNFFSNRSAPIISTGIVSTKAKTFCIVNAIGGGLQPDHRGFTVEVNVAADAAKKDNIARSFFVHWHAIGW